MATDNLSVKQRASTTPDPAGAMEGVFNKVVAMALEAKNKEGDKKEPREATDNEVWPPVLGTKVISEGSDALRYVSADGAEVLVKRDVNPKLFDYLSKLSELNTSSDSLEYLDLQDRLHSAGILRGEDSAPALADIQDIEKNPANDDVMLIMLKDGKNLVATRQLTPELFETLSGKDKTPEGIATSEKDGYELVNDNPFTDADINGANIGFEGEMGPGLVRAEIFDGKGGSRKVIVAQESNPDLYDRLVTTDESRRYDDAKIDEARKNADLSPSGTDVTSMETTTADSNDKNRKLTVSELTWQNLLAEWKTGIDNGSIGKDDDRAKLYNTLRAKSASEEGLDMVVLDMSMGQSTTRASADDLKSIIDNVKVDESMRNLFGSESVQKDFQTQQQKALESLPDKDKIFEDLKSTAFSEQYMTYINDLKKDNAGLAEADIAKTYASLAAFDPDTAAQFAQSIQIDGLTMDLDQLMKDSSAINDENTVLATQDTIKTLLTTLKKGGIDIARRTVETERFIQEFLGDKQTAKAFGEALKELGATFAKNGTVTSADIDKVMSKDIYKSIPEGAHGSMLKTISEMNSNGMLGSAGGLISLASGIYQLAGKGGTLADTPEERLAIAKDFVSVLGAGQHFVNLGTNIIDDVRGTQLNQMMGLDKSLPQIFGTDKPVNGRPFSIVEGDLKKLFEDFNAAIDAAPIDNKEKLAEKLKLSDEDMTKVTDGFRDGFAKNPGLKGSTPTSRGVSAFLRVMDAGANTFTGVADLVLGGLKIKSGVNSGDKTVVAQGAITVASGAFNLAGGGAQIAALFGSAAARALAGPLLWVGAALTVALTPFLIVEDIKHNNRMDKHRDDLQDLFSKLEEQGLLTGDGAQRYEFLDEYMYNYGQRDAPDDVGIFDYRSEEYEFYAGEGHLPERGFDDVKHDDYKGDGDNLDTVLDRVG